MLLHAFIPIFFFFFNDTATTEIYTLSLHDALPIPNINCMPSKNEIWSANVAYLARHAAEFGTTTGPVATHMSMVRQRKRDMVDDQVAAHLRHYKDSGAELIMGSGRLVAAKTLEVRLNDGDTRVLTADQVFLNVGTHATMPEIPGLEA